MHLQVNRSQHERRPRLPVSVEAESTPGAVDTRWPVGERFALCIEPHVGWRKHSAQVALVVLQ
jgi:hypothetical protein